MLKAIFRIVREIGNMNATQLIAAVSIFAMGALVYALHILQQALG